jgi:hypothetical protein
MVPYVHGPVHFKPTGEPFVGINSSKEKRPKMSCIVGFRASQSNKPNTL